MPEKTIRVRMLGNHLEYEAGKEYDLPVEKANRFTGSGFAVPAAALKKDEEEKE
jgi:hypothetical protein